MDELVILAPLSESIESEVDIQHEAVEYGKTIGYVVKQFKCGIDILDKSWPSKTGSGTGSPDTFLLRSEGTKPVCVWENKPRTITAQTALGEAKFYVEGIRKALPNETSLPRIAAGFNGDELLVSYYNNFGKWIPIKISGSKLKDSFPPLSTFINGISDEGVLNGPITVATTKQLRELLYELKTIYRTVSILALGRRPIDFTIALFTLKMLVEQNPDWGTWADQPLLAAGAASYDHRIAERFKVLHERVNSTPELKKKYGDIFEFKEHTDTDEIAFNFQNILDNIPKGKDHFIRLYKCLDKLPSLRNVDFDVFGEVYQYIGDEATKKKLGQFFTGRHIISGILPLLFEVSGLGSSFESIMQKKIADIACGTGGFLTETLKYIRRILKLTSDQTKYFAEASFYGYDLSQANASRARVNM